jgi:hypothetical protein
MISVRSKPLTLIAGTAIVSFGLTGCAGATTSQPAKSQAAGNSHDQGAQDTNAEVAAERAKLSTDDRALVEAQEWCVVSEDERLGSMGPPIKLDVNGQAVFICCKGCQRKALADPARTLAKLEELKAKKKSQAAKP